MLFITAYLIAPLVFVFLILGLGLLINSRSESKINLVYLLLLGLIFMISLGQITTSFSGLAKFSSPLILCLSVLGLALNYQRLITILKNGYQLLALTTTYFFAVIPALIYRKVTWPGWVQLDDTSTFLAITNYIFTFGQKVPTTLISTYDRTIQVVLGGSFYGTYSAATNDVDFNYPIGSLIPLGVLGKVMRIDFAWLYFPILAICMALTAGLFFLLLEKIFINKNLRLISAVTAASATTYYSYILWGGIKEAILVPILTFLFITSNKAVSDFKNKELSRRSFFLYLLTLFALFATSGKSSIGFIIASLVVAMILNFINLVELRVKKDWIFGSVLLLVILFLAKNFIFDILNKYFIPKIPDSGNLARPVNLLQSLGIWPSGDFRSDLYWQPYSLIFIAIVIILTAIGLFHLLKLNQFVIPTAVAVSLAIMLYSSKFSGIWLTGKAIAVASPFLLLAALSSISLIARKVKFVPIAYSLIAVLVAGVGTSNYLAVRHTWLAPSEKVQELAQIGREFKSQGPALMTDYSSLGSRYFLRDISAESASELRVNPIPMRDGNQLKKGFAADIDLFDNKEINNYQLLVLKHTAVGSRPLFNYDLKFTGKYYDVWKLNKLNSDKILSLGLGNNLQPGGQVDCKRISDFASKVNGKIYAAVRKPVQIISLSDNLLPTDWRNNSSKFGAVYPSEKGVINSVVEIPDSDEYEVFVGGSFGGKLEIFIDANRIFNGNTFFEGNPYLSNRLTKTTLEAGKHSIQIKYSSPLALPGAGNKESLGPIYFSSETASTSKVISAPVSNVKALCGQNLDWIAGYSK